MPNEPQQVPRDERRSAGRALRRGLAVLVGLGLALVLVELALQVGSLFVRGDRPVASGGDVVCQGDSNTYGLHLPVEHGYPQQLEALLRACPGELESVANLGVPGKTSWVVAEQLAQDLERFGSRAAIVWCGVNDFSERRPPAQGAGLLDRLRTVKMIRRMLATAEHASLVEEPAEEPDGRQLRNASLFEGTIERLDGERSELRFEDRMNTVRPVIRFTGTPDPEQAERALEDQLVEVAALVRARGSTPILLSYPVDTGLKFSAANRAFERAVERSGARGVDSRPAFAQAFEWVEPEALLFGDNHPTRLGHSIVARLVLQALADEGLVELAAPVDPLEEVRAWQRPALSFEPWREEGAIVGLQARYEAGHRVQFVVSGAPGSGAVRWTGALRPAPGPEATHTLPLALDEPALGTLKRPTRYLAAFEADGTCRVRFHEELQAAAARGDELWACAVLVHPGQQVGEITQALRLE